MRKNKNIERTEVLNPCMKLCKQLKIQGWILKWRRLDALDYYHEAGDPDLEIWFPKDNHVWILMAECKKPIGGKLRPSQIAYRNKYKKFNNIIYAEIRSVAQLEQLVKGFSDFEKKEFEAFMKGDF